MCSAMTKFSGKCAVNDYARTIMTVKVRALTTSILIFIPFQLRLLYECNPMAFIMEQAGGRAIDGSQRILDIQPTKIHERAPIFMGSQEDVNEVEAIYKKYRK